MVMERMSINLSHENLKIVGMILIKTQQSVRMKMKSYMT